MSDDLPMNDSIDGGLNQAANQNVAASEQEEQPQISAGEQLRTLREARGWSAAQVANQLNLATRQIEALEHDNYAALPGMVIVRGFVRSYAKIMQADATPILAAINGGAVEVNVLPPARSEMSASFTETQLLSDHPRRGSFFKLVSWLVILLIFAMAAFFIAQRMHWLPQKMVLSPVKIESELTSVVLDKPKNFGSEQTKIAAGSSDSSQLTSNGKPLLEANPVEKNTTPAPATSAAATMATSASATNEDKAAPAVSSAAVSASGKNALSISASEDSWLEIKQEDDTIIVSRILQAGSSEIVNVSKPVAIVIGNAAGVTVTFRGKPVDITTGNTSNVARLNLK